MLKNSKEKMEIELRIGIGKGYVPSEENDLPNLTVGTLSMDIKNFFPSIRDELILQILLISDIVGSSMLIYREVEFYRERKK